MQKDRTQPNTISKEAATYMIKALLNSGRDKDSVANYLKTLIEGRVMWYSKEPDASRHNPDPDYLRMLILLSGETHEDLCRRFGISKETLTRNYLGKKRGAPYLFQHCLECLAVAASVKPLVLILDEVVPESPPMYEKMFPKTIQSTQ